MASRTYRKTCQLSCCRTETSLRTFLALSSRFASFYTTTLQALLSLTDTYFSCSSEQDFSAPRASTPSQSRHQIRSLARKGFFQLVDGVKSGQRAAWHSNGLDGNSACPQPLQPSISLERIAMDRDSAQRGASPSKPMLQLAYPKLNI